MEAYIPMKRFFRVASRSSDPETCNVGSFYDSVHEKLQHSAGLDLDHRNMAHCMADILLFMEQALLDETYQDSDETTRRHLQDSLEGLVKRFDGCVKFLSKKDHGAYLNTVKFKDEDGEDKGEQE